MNGDLPNDSSRISNLKLYDAIRDVSAKLDVQALEIRTLISDLKDHEERLRKMEKWKAAMPVSLILFAATAALSLAALFAGRGIH